MQESILVYRSHLYLKLATILTGASVVAYLWHRPLGVPNGGTWLGYTLGTIAALIMVWLAWFGVRKRRYGVGKLMLEDWLSAHVYFGLALGVIATLHAGFQIGWNIHAVVYVLVMLVIVSGSVGVYFYVRFPRILSENRRGMTLDIMLGQIAEIDREMRQLVLTLDDATNKAILLATEETAVGETLFGQISGHDPHCATTRAREFVERAETAGDDGRRRQILTRLVRKEELLVRLRRDVQLRALLKLWLFAHVPFSVASMVALFIHIVTVFYYW
ncbi:MAG: hypothetical protein FJX59_14540 [Alphaproteobacteria bacterium]|nr:hypothetical protein [Alphaproteobacteria bacterium]